MRPPIASLWLGTLTTASRPGSDLIVIPAPPAAEPTGCSMGSAIGCKICTTIGCKICATIGWLQPLRILAARSRARRSADT